MSESIDQKHVSALLGDDRFGVLSNAALDRVISAPGMTFDDDVFLSYRNLLRDECVEFIRHSSLKSLDKKTFKKFERMKRHIDSYVSLSKELYDVIYTPPPLPSEVWLQHLQKWIENPVQQDVFRRGRPPNWWLAYFRPRVLGLYTTIFGVNPTVTIPRNTPRVAGSNTPRPGGAILFVLQLRQEIRDLSQQTERDGDFYWGPHFHSCWKDDEDQDLDDSNVKNWIRQELDRKPMLSSSGDVPQERTHGDEEDNRTFLDFAEIYRRKIEMGMWRFVHSAH